MILRAVQLAAVLGLIPCSEAAWCSTADPQVATEQVASVEELVAMGGAMADLGRYNEAISTYSLALKQDPNNGIVLANRALAYAWTNRIDEAARDLAAAEKRMADVAVLHRVRAIIANRKSDQDTELAELTRSLQLEPGNIFSLSFRSMIYQQRGQYKEALADADALIAARPEEPEAYERKAYLLGAQGNWAAALNEAEKLAGQFHGDPRVLASAASIFQRAGRRGQAMAVIDQAISRNETAFYLWERRAGIRRWDEFNGRQRDLETALMLSPGDLGIVAKLGVVALERGDYAVAAAHFSTILAKEPKDFLVFAYRAMASDARGDKASAERDYEAAARTASGAGDHGRICRALVTHAARLQWAEQSCAAALSKIPDRGSFLTSSGLLQLRKGNMSKAIESFNLAINKDRDNAMAIFGRGLARLGTGDVDQAKRDKASALAIDPTISEDFESWGFASAELAIPQR